MCYPSMKSWPMTFNTNAPSISLSFTHTHAQFAHTVQHSHCVPIEKNTHTVRHNKIKWLLNFVYQEAVFMGNGEQYIWKPPEEDEIITLHPPPLRAESVQGHPSPPTAKEVVYVCVCVCVNRQTDIRTGLWFVTAVFTDRGAPLIGHAVITPLPCDLPVIRGFCLQPEVTLHPNPLPEPWPKSPSSPTHLSVSTAQLTRQIGHQCHLLTIH